MADLRLAIVHDYLNQYGGAERVVETFHRMYPSAPIYTSLYDARKMPDAFARADVRTSFLQHVPLAMSAPKVLLPLYPAAFESLDVRGYDVVLSSSSAFGKGVMTDPETPHICYCHTPMRFAWRYHDYMDREGYSAPMRWVLALIIGRLRAWDLRTAGNADYFIANSETVARRIERAYRRDAEVIPPPVECARFRATDGTADFFLVVSRLRAYKRIDIAVAAFSQLGLPLRVVGDGDDRGRLQGMAAPNVQLLGRLPDADVAELLSRCRALIFPGEEDFGITPLEAQAAGRPVIAYGAGGALETVIEGETGVFFREPSPDSLAAAVRGFDADEFDPARIRQHAEQFDVPVFERRMREFVDAKVEEHGARMQRARDPAP
jgi:glycosyltransferase involved in cell wall biosynthesis